MTKIREKITFLICIALSVIMLFTLASCGGDEGGSSGNVPSGSEPVGSNQGGNETPGTTNSNGGTTNSNGGTTNSNSGTTNSNGGTTNSNSGTTNSNGGTNNSNGGTAASSGNVPQDKPCEHKGGEATCTAKAKCELCGEEYGDLADHTFVDRVCSACGEKAPSEGLKFELSNDKEYYIVTGIGTCTDTDLVIPRTHNNKPVSAIGERAFDECYSLTSITIPASVTSIGEYAFNGCDSLTSVNISDIASWCSISFGDPFANPLWYANNLYLNGELVTDLVIPEGVTSIGDYAFLICTSLTSITIPEGVTSIGNYAFVDCDSLINIKIPEGVTSIGNYAFAGCDSLTNIKIPEGVTSIGERAFSDCRSLTSITVDENNKSYKSIDGNLYTKDGKMLVQYAIGKADTSFVIPDSVTTIGSYAFFRCDSWTSITIPNSVTSIGDYAFAYCTGLKNVTIPEGVTSIGDSAFYYCPRLTIYCEASSKPSGWDSEWNSSNSPVFWGHTHS